MTIDSITNGIVLDHIAPGRGMDVYQYLRLDRLSCGVAIMLNVKSTKRGRKDLIKIDEEIELNVDVLGYLDPGITVNVIRDGQIVRKFSPTLPARLTNVLRCRNPRCVTGAEPELEQVFVLTDSERRVYRCLYCETAAKPLDAES